MLELLFSIVFDYVFFNIGKLIIFLATLGKVKATLDDYPFNNYLTAILGLAFVVAFVYLILI